MRTLLLVKPSRKWRTYADEVFGWGCDSNFAERDFCLVSAEDAEEAIYRYVKEISSKEAIFIEFVYDRSINMSFAEEFWLQTDEEQSAFTDNEGDVLAGEEDFKRRVREFFADHHEYADLYLSHWYSEVENSDIEFPEKMLEYIYFNTSWVDGLIAIPLHEIVEI